VNSLIEDISVDPTRKIECWSVPRLGARMTLTNIMI